MSPTEFEAALDCCLRIATKAGLNAASQEDAVSRVLSAAGLFVSETRPTRLEGRFMSLAAQVESRGFAWLVKEGRFVSWPDAKWGLKLVYEYWRETGQRLYIGVCQQCTGELDTMAPMPLGADHRWSARDAAHLCSGCIRTLRWGNRAYRPKLAFVGEVSPDGRLPLMGPSGDNLRRLMGVSTEDFYRDYIAINLLPRGTHRPSGLPERTFLRLHSMGLEPFLASSTAPVIALGRRAALGLADGSAVGESHGFEVFERLGRPVYALPHPSGRCRQYNDPDVRDRAAKVLARLAAHQGDEK